MNRLIPISGALTAALGSLLAMGPASAVSCTFSPTGGTCNNFVTELGDKRFTVLTPPTIGSGVVDWTTANQDLYEVDVDWADPGLPGATGGNFGYSVEIFTGSQLFSSVGLDSVVVREATDPDTVVTKKVYQGLDGSGPLLQTLVSINGSNVPLQPIGGTQIFVSEDFNVGANNLLDNVVNPIKQSDVPGPLPIVGVAAALGWSRRMKRRLALR